MDLRFVYDGWNLVQEIDGLVEVESGVTDVAREYTWGLDLSGQSGNVAPANGRLSGIHGAGGIGGLLGTHWTLNTTSTSDDKAYIYFYDANGNVGQMIDVVSGSSGYGTIAAKYEYYPFGGLLVADGVAAEANPFRFSTKYRDNETGSYYYGYRYLRTKHGRWLNRDPLGEEGGVNLFSYVSNSAPIAIDSLGLKDAKEGVKWWLTAVTRSWIDTSGPTWGFSTGTWWNQRTTFQKGVYQTLVENLRGVVNSDHGLTDAQDKKYRLWTTMVVTWNCCGDNITDVAFDTLRGDVGTEGALTPAPGVFDRNTLTSASSSEYYINYRFRARPHWLAEPQMQLIGQRTSTDIWHSIEGSIWCAGGRGYYRLRLRGSLFPSHQLFEYGAFSQTLKQRELADLWFPSSTDPTLIR